MMMMIASSDRPRANTSGAGNTSSRHCVFEGIIIIIFQAPTPSLLCANEVAARRDCHFPLASRPAGSMTGQLLLALLLLLLFCHSRFTPDLLGVRPSVRQRRPLLAVQTSSPLDGPGTLV